MISILALDANHKLGINLYVKGHQWLASGLSYISTSTQHPRRLRSAGELPAITLSM